MKALFHKLTGGRAMRLGLPWMALFGLAIATGGAHAQGTDWPNEYAKRVRSTENVSPLSDEAFGDKVSLFNGTVSFRHPIISIPGNSDLPVELSLTHDPHDVTFGRLNGNWDIDIPNVSAIHHSQTAEVKGQVPYPGPVSNGNYEFDQSMYWSGNRLTIGGGDLLNIPPDPKRVKPARAVATPDPNNNVLGNNLTTGVPFEPKGPDQ